MQVMTNYTTYDLAYYYADLARLPRVSKEERQQLLTSLSQAKGLDKAIQDRLIEGYLKLTTHLAIDRCPPSHHRLLPDIFGEVALTLVNITNRYDFQAGKDFTAYIVACTEGAVKRAIANERPIRVPSKVLRKAREKGTEKALYDLQPDSLDQWMQWYETDELEESLASPILPTTEAPPRNPVLRAQVQEWLSYLPRREQAVLTLRYGLSDDDERCLTPIETARALGLKREAVYYAERDAIERIRTLIEGTAIIVEKDGKPQVQRAEKRKSVFKPPTSEQESLLMQAALRLCEQGIKVTTRVLAKETGINYHLACAFLRLHRDKLPLVARARPKETREARLARLAHLYAECLAKGERGTIQWLAKTAHVGKKLVKEFLHNMQKKEDHAA